MAIKDFLDAVAPKYAAPIKTASVEILEQDPGAFLKKVVWSNADFQFLDHQLAKDLTSFFTMAGAPDVFRHDCDGTALFEIGGSKYMFLTELKSNFATENLMKAKKQIVSSFLKTNMLLQLSSCYRMEDYIIKGFIVGYPPKSDFKIDLYKGTMLRDKRKVYEFELTRKLFCNNPSRSIILEPTDFVCLGGLPLGERGIFPKIELHFIEVIPPASEVTLSVRNYI